MKDTVTIGKVFGIPLKIHWSFWLLFFYVAYQVTIEGSYFMLIYLLFLFLCVVLHEYGHAMAARHYGINTKDIILSPLGGVARLLHMPHEPRKEIVIALAGPLVNLVLSLIFIFILYLRKESIVPLTPDFENGNFILMAALTNAALFLFNLIPAFPMDGGRILRAFFCFFTSRGKATLWASIIGRGLAILMIGAALIYGQYLYVVMGVVLFLMAAAESKEALAIEKMENYFTYDFYTPDNGQFLSLENRMEDAFKKWKHFGIAHFVVLDENGKMYCWFGKKEILDACKLNKLSSFCHEFGKHNVTSVMADLPMSKVVETMHQNLTTILVVTNDEGTIIGTVDFEAVNRAISL